MGQTDAALQSLSAREGADVAPSGVAPSYKERAAFIQTLKKKWMLQKGYCSVFDRLREQRLNKRKVQQRRGELDGRKKLKKRIVAQCLQRGAPAELLRSLPEVQPEALAGSEPGWTHQMEMAMNKQDAALRGLPEQNVAMMEPSRSSGISRRVAKREGFTEFGLLGRSKTKAPQASIRSGTLRPRSSTPSKSQRPFNKDIHELTQSSHKNQTPRSLKEWEE